MTTVALCLATLLLVGVALGQGVDRTRVPGTHGAGVVEAVAHAISESCVFPNDHRFLRRLAKVASNDGDDASTYRLGFDGGIWQVTQAEFQATKTSALAQKYYGAILQASGIDWNQVSWSDLRKPLYSGIAEMLNLIRQMQLTGGDFPRTKETQAQFYEENMRGGASGEAYAFLQKTNGLSFACGTDKIDLAFLVDSSSSLSPDDFTRAKNFAGKIVEASNVNANGVRVAFVTFSTGYTAYMTFNQYQTSADVKAAIQAVKQKLGNTDTHLAMGYAADTLFTASSGSRWDAAKIAIVLTDGVATDPLISARNAEKLRSKGVNVFVIGVGNSTAPGELTKWASDPSCTHVQSLDQYAELDTLQAEIRQVSCQTNVILPTPTPGKPIHTNYQCGKTNSFQITSPVETTISIKPRSGFVQVFGSYSFSRPSSSIRDFEALASSTKPAMIYIQDTTKPLYLTVQSDVNLAGQCTNDYDLDIQFGDALIRISEQVCIDRGVVRQCTPLDLLRAMYQVTQVTPPSNLGFPNPCLNNPIGGYGFHVHPFDLYKFVYCDGKGNVYIVQCNVNQYYMDSARDCINGKPTVITTPKPTTQRPTTQYVPITPKPTTRAPVTPGPTSATVTQISGGLCSMCTTANWNAGNRFFPYPGNNETLYIMCTEYVGVCKVKQCADFHKWNQRHLACVYTDLVLDYTKNIYQTSPNPSYDLCPPGRVDTDIFFHPHPTDAKKFFHCDEFGNTFIQECPQTPVPEIWNEALMTCVPGVPVGKK